MRLARQYSVAVSPLHPWQVLARSKHVSGRGAGLIFRVLRVFEIGGVVCVDVLERVGVFYVSVCVLKIKMD